MKMVDTELYDLAIALADQKAKEELPFWLRCDDGFYLVDEYTIKHNDFIKAAHRYLELREASGEPMPYKIVRDGNKVRFE